jgi:hypothetical protein
LPFPNFFKTEKDTLGTHDDRIRELEKSVDLLRAMGAPSGDGGDTGGLLKALESMLDKLRDEIFDKFAMKVDLDNLSSIVDDLEQLMKD